MKPKHKINAEGFKEPLISSIYQSATDSENNI